MQTDPMMTMMMTTAAMSASGLILVAQDDSPDMQAPPPSTGEGADQGATTAPGGPAGPGGPPQAPGFQPWIWLPFLLLIIFIFWSSSSAQRKEKKKREAMLASLSKHARVQTIGGIIGSVVEVKDSEVVLKVDEANNIKMRFARSAIQQILSETGEPAAVKT